jgi:heptosyltransferase-2
MDLFVSNDMGLSHLASAVGTKTLVIFGPTNDVNTRPLGENAAIIRHPVECSPCMLRECPIDHRCMTRILPEAVFQKAIEMINA